MADIKSLIDKFNIFRTKDSILNDVAKDNGQITIDIKQPFSDDIDSNNSLKTKLETNIKDKLFNTEINNVGSNIFDEKIKPFDKGYNVSNTPDTDTKTPIDTTPIKPDTPTIEKNTADATAIQQEKKQQPEITTPKPKPTQQYKPITEQQNNKLTTDSLGNPMPTNLPKKGTGWSGVGQQQIDDVFNLIKNDEEKFNMFQTYLSEAYNQLKSANLNNEENIIYVPFSYDHENGNMQGITLRFGLGQKEWAEKQLKILEKGIIDKQNEEWLSNLKLPQPKTTMDKIASNRLLDFLSYMMPETNGMEAESKQILEEGQRENRLNATKWSLIQNIKECQDVLNKYNSDKSQLGTALSGKNLSDTFNNIILPQIELVRKSDIADIVSKWKKNPNSLTPIEKDIVNYYSDYVKAVSVITGKTSIGYDTVRAIEQSLPFMADFLRFNFVNAPIKGAAKAAMKVGGKSLAKQTLKDAHKTLGARAFRVGDDILTAAGHTSVSPLTFTNMLEDYSQTMETNGQYTKNDLRRGVIEAFTENFSERMFGALKGIMPKSNNAFVNSLFGNNPVIKSMQKHMNVGGLFEENAEEYAGAFLNTIAGFALGDEKLASSFKEQLNNSVPTILSIGITVGLPQAIGMGIDFRQIRNTNKRFNVAEDNLKQYFNKENSYIDINRYSDGLKSLYINLNNAKNEEDKAEIKGKIAELNKTAANLAMEKGDSNGFNLISEYSIAAQNSFYVTNKAMSELKDMSEEDRTKLVDNAINKLKNDFTNNLNWSLISRAAAKNITDQNGKQHPTCFLYTDNGVTYVLNGQKDNMFYFVDVNGNTISKSADELRNNENLSVLHLNNLLSFGNKELEDINSKFIDIAQYNAGYRYKVNDNGEIRYYTDNKDLIKSNIPYEQINRDKIESHLVGSYDLVRIDNITNAVEDMAKAFAEPAAEQTSSEQQPAEQPAEEQPAQETAQETIEQPAEEPIQEQPQEQTTQETAQEQQIQEQTTEEEPIQTAQQQIEPTQQQIEPTQEQQTAQEEDNSTSLNGVPDIIDDTPQDAREQQGSTRDAATRERTKDGERTADSAGSIDAENRIAQNEQANTESQGKKPTETTKIEKIEDVGEKIGGSRKDAASEYKRRAEEDLAKPTSELEKFIENTPISKIFNFDLKKLREQGISNEVVSFIKIAKQSIPPKPRNAYKRKIWVSRALSIYQMCLYANTKWDRIKEILEKDGGIIKDIYQAYMSVGGFDGGLELNGAALHQLGKEASVYKNGKRISLEGKWRLENAGYYDDIYDTKEEAIEALKKFAGKNAVKPKSKQIEFTVYQRRSDNTLFITPKGKSNIIIQDGFKSSKEAFDYIKEHQSEMEERYKTLMSYSNAEFGENRERKGRDYRGGKDISAQEFMETFGFRGVEFGNWTNQKDRQVAINNAYDAFMDLAEVLGVSPKALSLNGKLGMAFGARGRGKFNAHYERDKVVINLTKTKGAGSLAHEWFHALDHYFATLGKADSMEFATNLHLLPKGVYRYIDKQGNYKYHNSRGYELSEEEVNKAFEANGVRREMVEAWYYLMDKIRKSDYYKRSEKYSILHTNYWIDPTELGARAFSKWVENELSKRNATNDYLANNPALFADKVGEIGREYTPYPFDTDAEWIEDAFGNLFQTMEQKTDEETGNVILYQKSDGTIEVLSTEEAALRDALIDKLREAGIDVITDVEEAQRVLDEANGKDIRQQKVKSYDPRHSISPVRGEWTKGKIIKRLKDLVGSRTGYSFAAKRIAEFDSADELAEHMFYHGTQFGGGRLKPSILMSDREIERIGGGGYGEKYWGISVSSSKRIASNFSQGRSVSIYPIILVKNAKVKEMPELTDAADLEDYIEELWKEGVDAVWIGDKNSGEQELCVLNPHAIVNIGSADIYKYFNLGTSENPLHIIDANGIEKLYQDAKRYVNALENKPKKPLSPSPFFIENDGKIGEMKSEEQYQQEMSEYEKELDKYNNSDEARRFKQEDEYARRNIRFFRTADGDAYGFTVGGKIYIDPRIANADTPIHEYAHLWASAMQKLNPNEWENIVKLMKGTPIWEEVKRNYPELTTDNEIADEVLAFYSGSRGAERLREEHAKILKGNGNVVEKVKAINAIKRVREALKRFWKNVAEWFGIHFTTAEEVADKVLSDLLNGVNPTLAGIENDIRFEENSEEAEIVARAKADGTYMKAPNGKQSNLSPRQWVQVRTKAFKDWFGDWENDKENSSKVVDENGEPMVVYHGSGQWFHVFNGKSVIHKSNAADNTIYMSDKREMAESYVPGHWFGVSDGEKSKTVKDVILDENSPLHKIYSWGIYREGGIYPLFANIKYPYVVDFQGNGSLEGIDGMTIDEIVVQARKEGYDGVIAKNIKDVGSTDEENIPLSTDIIAFEPNQVKSATDNVGTFDQNNPDIRYSKYFGGNSGYVGYSMSKRAAQAREEGRYPKNDFKKNYGITDKSFNALVNFGYIDNSEWHHTSKFGNKTTFYEWENEEAYDAYKRNKKEIDALTKEYDKLSKDVETEQWEMLAENTPIKGYELNANRDWNVRNSIDNIFREKAYKQLQDEGKDPTNEEDFNARVEELKNTEEGKKYEELLNRREELKKAKQEREKKAESIKADIEKLMDTKDITDEKIVALNAEIENDFREGVSTNDELSQSERQRIAERVNELAEKLQLDNVEVVTDASTLEGNKKRAKGFYSKSTGKITIVIPNHVSTFDAEQTLLHEAVAHYGLRQLFGEHFDTFLDNVFNNADKAIRKRIIAIASKNGFDLRTATEEYLATLAENTEFETAQKAGWWQKIKDLFLNMLHRIGFEDFGRVTLTDNELRYILWRSYENLANGNNSILGDATDEAKQKELGVGNYAATNKNSTTTNEDDIRYRRASNRSVISSRFERQAEIQREEKNTKSAANIVLGNANVVLNDTNIFDEQYQNAIDNNLIDENVSPLIDSFGITWGYQLKNGVIVINKDVFISDILDKRVKDNLSLLISSLMKTNKTFFKEGISFFKKLPIWVLYKNDTKSNEDTIKEIINDILLGNTSIDTNKLELLKQYTVKDMNDILDNATKWFEKFEGISSNMFAGNSISDILDTTLGDLMPKEITTTQEGKRLNWFSKLGIDIRSKLFDSLDWFRVVSDKTKDKTASELYDAMIVHTKRVQGKIDIFDKEYVRPIIDTIQSMLGKDFGNSTLSLDLIQEYFAIKSLLGRTASLYKERFGEYLANPEGKKPQMFDEFKQIYDEITEDEIKQRINEMGEKSDMSILQKVDIDYLMEEVRRTLAAEKFVKQYVYSSANTLNQGLQGEQSLGLINEVTNEPYSELYQLLYSDEQSSQTMHSPIEIIEQADILIDRAGLRNEFDFIGNQIQAILNHVNIERVENGLMSYDTFAKRQLMKDFVNQRGENSSEGNLYEITAKQKANEKMKGKDWFNPNSITSIIAVAQTEIATMEKELLAQRLSYFLTNPNNFDVLSQYGMIIDEKETLNEELNEDERNSIMDKNIVLLYGERHTDKNTKGQVDKKKINILKRNDDGTFTKVTISFDNKFIGLEEFVKFVNNNFKYEELRGISKAVAPFTAWTSRIYTILSPLFPTKNLLKDLMVTPWLPAKELNGKNSQYAIKNFYNAFNNLSFILKMSFTEKSFSKKGFENKLKARSQELFEYYLEYSKQHSIFSIEDQIGALSKEDKTLQDIERALSSKENKFIKFTERALLIKFMQHYAEVFENLHKFSAYVTLRKLGYGEERSAQIANNATLNYDRSGSIGRQLNAIIPFAKAALGGLYRTNYLLPKYNPKGFLQRVITLAVLGVMQGLMYDPDDDDISEFARKSGMVFGSFLYPLLPEELSIVRPVRALVIVMAGKKSPAYFKQELMESTIDLVPIASDALRGAFSYNPLTNKPEFDAGQLFANTDKMTAVYALAMLASYINENKNSFGKNVLLNEETNTDKTRYGRTKQDYGLYDYIARLYNSILNGVDIDDRAAMSNKIGKNGERLMTIAKEDVEFVINNYIPFGRLYAYTAEIIYDAVNDKRINKGHIPLIGGLFAQKSFGKDYYLINNIKYELKDFTNDFSQSQIEDIKTNILDKAGIREGIRYKALKDHDAPSRMLDKAKRNMNEAFNVFILNINNVDKKDFTEDEQKFMLYSFLNSSIMKKALSIGEDTLNKHTAKMIEGKYNRYDRYNNENIDTDKEKPNDAVKKFKKELYDKSITEKEFNNKLNSLWEPMTEQIKLRAKLAGFSINL